MMQKIRFAILFMVSLIANNSIAAEPPIVALLSDDSAIYQQVLNSFKASSNKEILLYNLKGDIENAPSVLTTIMQQKPALIFALGAKAAWFAKSATREKPETAVLFAMALNHQRYQLNDGQSNIAGISADIAPGTQLFNLSLFSPDIKRVGLIYSHKHSDITLEKARLAADILGIQLIAEPITRAKEFKRAWLKISDRIDAFWVLNDPVLYTLENIYWLKNRCLKGRIVCSGQSDNIARFGIILSVNPDIASIGAQASSIAHDIIYRDRKPADIGIKTPIGTQLTLNESTARKIGLTISPSARAIVTEVIKQ